MLTLYRITADRVQEYPRQYLETHCPLRLARAEQKKSETDRRQTLGAGILLYEVLGLEDKDILPGEHGKPYAKAAKPFNLSHAGEEILLAVCDAAVGVDAEPVTKPRIALAGRWFAPEEIRWMNENPEERFFILWTMKEALAKAVGEGISNALLSTSVLPLIEGALLPFHGAVYAGRYAIEGGFCRAVCAAEPLPSDAFPTIRDL